MFPKIRIVFSLVLLIASLSACQASPTVAIPPTSTITATAPILPTQVVSPTAAISPTPTIRATPEVTPMTGTPPPEAPVLGIARHPPASDYSNYASPNPALPTAYDPNSQNAFQNDYRSTNLSQLDLSQSLDGLLFSDFDIQTIWPAANLLPAGFDPQQIMELGKDPGLGVRKLHSLGIDGAGVAIAIIDQTLLVDHQEYADRLKWYEETNGKANPAQMHAPAVASIAVGKTVGVAPQAALYFLADNEMNNYSHLAQSVRRIITFNQGLPEGHKIRVISMSIGWMWDSPGVQDISAAVNEAKAAGIFVISTSLDLTDGMNLIGMGRGALADPNDFGSYTPSPWWSEHFYNAPDFLSSKFLLVPMDARATASPTGVGDYVFYGVGGESWAVPYLAGMYALACQVKPEITPAEFWSAALKTGRITQIEHNGKQYPFGVILDPQALIATLQK
jgi:subtilisin family serine protease